MPNKNIVIGLVTFVVTLVTLFIYFPKQKKPFIERPIAEKQTPNPTPIVLDLEESLNYIHQTELKQWLSLLASDAYEGRMSGKRGHFKAADFIEQKCKEWKLKTERHRFNIRRLNPGPYNEIGKNWTENVYAYIEGTDSNLKDEVIVVGAHLDHVGYGRSMTRDNKIGIHNGADDNGSGSVCLLGIAKAFARMGPMPRTIVFQWYSAEEMGLIGSRYYTNSPTFPKSDPDIRKHIFMLNMDMVGRLHGGVYSVGFYAGDSSIDVSRFIRELNNRYPFANKITSRGSGGSDHASFYNKRVPIAFLHTGLHNDYHKVTDDVDKINYSGMEKISKYATELAYKVMFSDVAPQFNHTDFKPMSYIHDHGHKDVEFIHPWHIREWKKKTGIIHDDPHHAHPHPHPHPH